jgi:hypothetical protein
MRLVAEKMVTTATRTAAESQEKVVGNFIRKTGFGLVIQAFDAADCRIAQQSWTQFAASPNQTL